MGALYRNCHNLAGFRWRATGADRRAFQDMGRGYMVMVSRSTAYGFDHYTTGSEIGTAISMIGPAFRNYETANVEIYPRL